MRAFPPAFPKVLDEDTKQVGDNGIICAHNGLFPHGSVGITTHGGLIGMIGIWSMPVWRGYLMWRFARGKVSAARFWHVMSGLGDFANGGGRYKEVSRSIMKDSETKRKIPFGLDLIEWAVKYALLGEESQTIRGELLRATTLGFLSATSGGD